VVTFGRKGAGTSGRKQMVTLRAKVDMGDTLTLSGERSQKDGDEQRTYSRRERWQGKFSRTIQLPFRIDAEEVDASFANGILNIILPRAEEDKPHRISISAN